jgi:hypothetical protein
MLVMSCQKSVNLGSAPTLDFLGAPEQPGTCDDKLPGAGGDAQLSEPVDSLGESPGELEGTGAGT